MRLIGVFTVLFSIVVVNFGFSVASAAAPAKAAQCIACHGPKGISVNPIWPNLAGQHKEYLVKQLKDFKAGTRVNPLMKPIVAGLTDKDFAEIAAYYAGLSCK